MPLHLHSRRRLRVALLASTCLLACAQAPAQPAAAAPAAAQHRFDIPAGPLAATLLRIAEQSGQSISVAPDLVRGLGAPAVQGTLSAEQALEAALQGSPLSLLRTANGTLSVQARPAAAAAPAESAAADAQTLAAVTVTATSVSGAPPVYAGGQVARAARLGILGNVNIMDAPFSVTAYTAQTIEDQQARTVYDLVAAEPSIRQAVNPSYVLEFYHARSFVLYGYDISLSGMYGVLPYSRVPVEIAERVEVLRGPSGMLYGQSPSGAVGGGINIVPKRAEDEPLTRLTTSYVSGSQAGLAVDIGRRFGERKQWGVRINGVGSSGGTEVDGQSLRRRLGSLALDYRGERVRLSLDAYDTRYRIDGGMNGGAAFSTAWVPRAPSGASNWFPGTSHDARDTGGVVRAEVDIAEHLTAYAAIGQRHHAHTGYMSTAARPIDPWGNWTGQLFPGSTYNDARALEAGLRGTLHTGPVRHEWNIGGTRLAMDAGSSTSRPTPSFRSNIYAPVQMPLAASTDHPAIPTSRTELGSAAIADTMSFAEDRVRLTLGLREQRVSVAGYAPLSSNVNSWQNMLVYQSSRYAAKATTPMVGLVVKPLPGLSLYANYIEGLTSGQQVSDRSATNYGAVFPPMKTRQTEVGAKWDLGTWTNTFAIYELKKPSLINVYSGTSYAVDGSGEQRNRGFEWSVFGQVARGVRLLGGVAFTDGKLTRTARGVNQGNTPFASPKWKLNLAAEWDVPGVPGLTLNARAIHNSWSWANSANTQRLPAWTRYDIGARYATEVAGKPTTFRAAVQNVTNKAYWDAGFYDGLLVLNAPRTILLSASVDF